jgi:hypothetical protein
MRCYQKAKCLVFAVMLWLGSCAPVIERGPAGRAEPAQRSWTAEELVENLARREQQFRSLRSLAAVSYQGPEGKRSFEEAVLVERPARLRLETLSPLGAVLVVTVDGKEVAGLYPRDGLFFRSESTKNNLRHTTRIPLELSEITAVLMGLPPGVGEAGWEFQDGALQRALAGGGKEIVIFDSGLGVPTRWQRVGAGGTIEIGGSFADFSTASSNPFPLRISLHASADNMSVDLRYRDPELNVEMPPGVFAQQKPAYAKEVPIEALTR